MKYLIAALLASLLCWAPMAGAQESDATTTLGPQITAEQVADTVAARIRDGIKKRSPLQLSDFARRETGISAEYAVMLKGIALYFDLHEAQLRMRSLFEAHASAYVRWGRARDDVREDRVTPRDAAEALSRVESTRLAYFKERTRVAMLRFELQELTGLVLPEEFHTSPPSPDQKPPDMIYDTLMERAKMTFAARPLRHAVLDGMHSVANSWQALIAAHARLDYLKRELLYRQQVYDQDRATSLGAAMTDFTDGEADVVRAIGRYRLAAFRLSIMLGIEEDDRLALTHRGLDPDTLYTAMGQEPGTENQRYVPKSGSGFGQDDLP